MLSDVGERFTIRPATAADLPTIADTLVAGLSTYRAWTPPGWQPPARTEMLFGLLQRFGHDGSWAHVALEGAQPAGHVALRRERNDVALLAQLFVREPYWGSGLATRLNALAVADMAERGFSSGRLLVAAGHRRAHRFYEREGWRATGAGELSDELGLELAEYVLELG